MNERLIVIDRTITDPTEGAAVGTAEGYFTVPVNMAIVYVCVAPRDDDTGATIDIQDDTADIITALDASDANVPGTWTSTHFGGTNAPVVVVAGSKLEFDFNSCAVANAFYIQIWALTGEVPA